MALERQGDYDAALTSYRLALRDRPNDTKILQNMAIAFTKTNRPEEAIRCYRSALEVAPAVVRRALRTRVPAPQARRPDGAEEHLDAFLASPPNGAEAERWIQHARETLETLRGGGAAAEDSAAEDAET